MTFVPSETVCKAAGIDCVWIRCGSALSVIVADGAGINLVSCVAVARPISGMGPGIRVAGRVLRASRGGETAVKGYSGWDSVAFLTVGQIVSCRRSVQSGGGVWDFMGRSYAGGMTSRCNAVCISEIGGKAAGSTGKRAGAGPCGFVAKSATDLFRILSDIPVSREIDGIRIICPFPIGGMCLRIGVAGSVGAVS